MGLAAAAGIAAVGTIAGAEISGHAASKAANTQAAAAEQAQQTQLQMYNRTRSDLSPFMSGGSNAFSQLANIFGFGGPSATANGSAPAGTTISPYIIGPDGMPTINPDYGNSVVGGSPLTGSNVSAGPAGSGQPNPALATQLLTQFPGYQFGLDQGQQALDRSAASKGLVLSGAQLKDSQQFGQGYAMQNAWNPFISQLNSAASLGENAAAGVGNIGASTGAGVASSQLAQGQAAASGIVGGANSLTSGISQLAGQAGNFISSYGNHVGGGEYTPSITGASSSPLALSTPSDASSLYQTVNLG